MQRAEKWTQIYKRLSKADQVLPLEPEELETLALAAYLTGRDAETFELLDRAHQGYLDQGRKEKAVHCVFWLGFMLINAGEEARGNGWIARGERILSDGHDKECPEKGLLLIPKALGELSAGHGAKALQIFKQVASAGDQFQNVDLIVLGRLGMGQALIQQGKITQGKKLLDETMITVETEDVFPLVNGIVYCAVIETCRTVWDLERAQEWTAAFARWCEAQQDLVPFRGECLVRRAEIIQFHGDLPKALEEMVDACDILSRHPVETATGEAYYRQAELHRLIGNFRKAEDCYLEAAKRGRKPQPGLALLRLVQGSNDAAETSIRNILQETKAPIRRAELLPAMVSIMLAGKQTDDAFDAAKELCEIARDLNVPYLLACCSYCLGSVFLERGDLRSALEQLQKSLKFWNALNLPYELACARERKGLVYMKLNDKDNAEAELMAAHWLYDQLGAVPDRDRVDRLLSRKKSPGTHGLSLREIQVLRLVASGKTNKAVAGELFISERTVDRHMSNIFNKIGVSSRVEATAFAYTNQLLDDDPQ